jgi:FHA domain
VSAPVVTLRLAPGSGLVCRRGSALLFVSAPDAALVDAFATSDEGAELQMLASATVAAGFDVRPYVGLEWGGGLRVMAFGDIAVETDQPSLPMLSGAGSRTWVEHTLALGARAVVEVAGGAVDEATDLVAGTVPAGGFRLELGVAAAPVVAAEELAPVPVTAPAVADETQAVARTPHDITPPAPAPPAAVDPDDPAAALAAIQAAAVGADGEPVPGAGVAPTATAPEPEAEWSGGDEHHDVDITLPPPVSEVLLADVRGADTTDGRGSLVDAKLCADGHANPPTAATCAVCGDFLAPGTGAVVHVPRPSLGRLQLDDGELIELDQELLIGRQPDRDEEPSRTRLRRVKALGDKVSRSHLEVRFQGWDVLVDDCGSTNGTFVVAHPGGQVMPLEPGRAQMVEPGAVVYFGSRSMTVLGRNDG